MALLLRTVRQNRWIKDEAASLLAQDDVPADCLGDMNTITSQLSVWELTSDRSNLERVVRAVAVGRDRIDNMGYVVFDSALVEGAGIEILQNPGKSDDEDANVWHRDLVLTGNKVVALTKAILRSGEPANVVLKVKMKSLVDEGIQTGQLPNALKQKFEKK